MLLQPLPGIIGVVFSGSIRVARRGSVRALHRSLYGFYTTATDPTCSREDIPHLVAQQYPDMRAQLVESGWHAHASSALPHLAEPIL